MKDKRFKIEDADPFTNDNDVLGGEVSGCNCYISIYPRILGDKQPSELEVNEKTEAIFALGGSKGTYYIRRAK